MKLDVSLRGMSWDVGFQLIREHTKAELPAVLIVRDSNIDSEQQCREYFQTINRSAYIKMGVVLNWFNLEKEILEQLKIAYSPDVRFENFRKIATSIEKGDNPINVIVIDNCHKIIDKNFFLLLGLMLQLAGRVQFFFILPDDQIAKLEQSCSTFAGKMFVNQLKYKYDFGG